MQVRVIGSGSTGNCYLIYNEDEVLILEAGMPIADIYKAVGMDGFDKVVGCLVTHEHADHAGHVKELLDRAVPVWMTSGTASKLKCKSKVSEPRTFPLIPGETTLFNVGGFSVIPFDTEHDAEEPCGYFIYHREMGRLAFVTDTFRIEKTFDRLDHLIIECNHTEKLVNARKDIPDSLKMRIKTSHLSLDNCKYMLLMQPSFINLQTLMLCHISEHDGDPELFAEEIAKIRYGNRPKIAKPGVEYDVELLPF